MGGRVDSPSFAAYLTLTAILVATPGASTALVVRHTLHGGRPAGLAATTGIAVANALWALAAGLGVTALLTRIPAVFVAIQVGGAGYLAFLGLRALWRALMPSSSGIPDGVDDRGADGRVIGAFRDGVAVNLLNPPLPTFYMVIVPSFLPAPAAPARFVLYAAIHIGLALAWQTAWVLAFDRLRRVWSRPAARRIIDAVTGAALLALAVSMLR
jgi:threonine/homoserine/homoserine lactone efflux protein